ncbi:MAG: 4Fe-4S cluster-binding domain-containing protein [Anaerolineales bacterium]|nr:4Fe-4S cluster-binding domain-containing protein [Anaerolineales bacterium]
MSAFTPAYLKLIKNGELRERVTQAYERLSSCDICAWECGINRRAGERGICKSGELARVSSYGPHMGEEDPLRGLRGSGTIFFSRCNLRCQYCQNHDISQNDSGELVEPERLAAMMLELQSQGCHNINFVSPSHVVPQILAGLYIAAEAGLRLPLVYNTGGYDSLATLQLLDGVIDIYMPDMKYSDAKIARRYSKIPHYPQVNRIALREMQRQVGDLQTDAQGVAKRGLLVRHLVLPNELAGTKEIVRFLAQEISPNTYLNLMDQYRPAFTARKFPELMRSITSKEYPSALQMSHDAGLRRLDMRKPRFLFL